MEQDRGWIAAMAAAGSAIILKGIDLLVKRGKREGSLQESERREIWEETRLIREELRKEVHVLKEDLRRLDDVLDGRSREIADLRAQIATLNWENARLKDQIDASDRQKEALVKENGHLRMQIEELRNDVQTVRRENGDHGGR